MATSWPAVTAIMPVRNDARHLVAAVDSVLDQDYPGQLSLIIGLGPSDDDTEAIAERLSTDPRVQTVANPSGLTAAGLNAALRESDGDVIVRVDAHCELPQNYIQRAVETLERTGAANVGGIQRAVGDDRYQRAVAKAMSSKFGVGDAKFHYGGTEGPVDTVYLGVFDATVLRSVGGFDETLIRNQDYELNWRLREAGHLVSFDPRLVVDYRPRATIRALASQYLQYGQWKREVIKRHPRSAKPRQLVAPLTVIGVAVGTIGALTGRRWMASAPLVYASAVGLAAAAESESPAEAVTLLSVFPTMHLAWGAGFLLGPLDPPTPQPELHGPQ